MSSRNISISDPIQNVTIVPDKQTHIKLIKPNLCAQKCDYHPCTYVCPSGVYYFDTNIQELKINYQRCVECGACTFACPWGNIDWHYPRPGYGVFYKY